MTCSFCGSEGGDSNWCPERRSHAVIQPTSLYLPSSLIHQDSSDLFALVIKVYIWVVMEDNGSLDNDSFLGRYRDWWSSDCSPSKYGIRCAKFTSTLILGGGLLINVATGFESDFGMLVGFLLLSSLIGYVTTVVVVGSLTWLLRRMGLLGFRFIEQSLVWWVPLLIFINFLSSQYRFRF